MHKGIKHKALTLPVLLCDIVSTWRHFEIDLICLACLDLV
jgi:hypothetical protein